jgi:hypothetical protein
VRKPWPLALFVIVVGGVAGLAIAGRPETVDPFVLGPGTTGAISTSSSSESAATTSTSAPATTTTIAAVTTVPAASTSVAATVVPTTAAPTTTEALPTTTIAGPLPRDQVRLVIANGDGRFRLASITADRIRSLGYVIALGDAVQTVDATVIYYRPDFDDEAAFAAIDIDVPDAIILPFPFNDSQPITDIDGSGDVIIVLGPDAPR